MLPNQQEKKQGYHLLRAQSADRSVLGQLRRPDLKRDSGRWPLLLAAMAVLGTVGARDCPAQRPAGVPPIPPSASSGPAQAESIFMPADRSVLLLLSRTRMLLNEGRYAEAVQCLDRILSGNEDYFFKPMDDASVHQSIKSEARRLLGSIPASGRQSYELQFGALARKTLEEAVETGNIGMLAEVARRFFHTEAGYEATYLLGLHHMDHGRHLVAALTLRRLRDEAPGVSRFEPSLSLAMARSWLAAGMPDQARDALHGLPQHAGNRSVTIEGRDVLLFANPEDSVDWLLAALGPQSTIGAVEPTDWTVYGGSPQRSAVSKGGRPLLNARWRIPTTDHPVVEAMIERLERQQKERETTLLPSLHPLIVNDIVLMRTATNLLAVDLETGKRLWEVPALDPFEAALTPPPDGRVDIQPNLEPGLRLRLWGDGVFGTLASDGQLVFAVEDLQLPSPAIYSRVLLAPGNLTSSAGSLMTCNRLAAFDIRSQGKLRWELGGPQGENALPLAGAFFLGPPLPLLGDLYVLAEIDGEVRLLALDAENGNVLWQQQLAVVDQSVYHDTLRRVSGVSPSYADGVLVCPTSHHSIVALELTTRSLLWGYSYAELERENRRIPNLFGTARHRTANPEDRWVDSTLAVADGCILATPVDSEQLHCLSLEDGRLLWRVDREDKLFVAAVSNAVAVVATRKGLTALRLKDGEPAWDTPLAACPQGSEPSGRGFSNGEQYFLPLTGGMLMTVDLASGRVEQVAGSRHGHTLGNLVCHDGKVVSQRADGIEFYHQREALRDEVARRLDANADDAPALAFRGEILWDEGRLDEATRALRRSLEITESIRTRSLLREVMFDGLAKDFDHYHAFHDEIDALIDTADDRATFYRLMTTGWEKAGQYDEALAQYALLVDLDLQHGGYVSVDENYSPRQDCWIRARLTHLHDMAPPEIRTQMLRWAEEALDDGRLTEGPDTLGQLLRYFGKLPGTKKYRDQRIERLVNAHRLSEAELALMFEVRFTRDEDRPQSLARWAELLVAAKRPADAASLLTKIETEWSAKPFADGEDGRRWLRDFEKEHDAVRVARQPIAWPKGYVETSITNAEPTNTLPSYGRGVIPFQGSKGLFHADLVVESQQLQIVARNGHGQIQWQFPLQRIDEIDQRAVSRSLMRVDSCGHLLILSVGNRIVALDTLATQDGGVPEIAWNESIDSVDVDTLRRQLPQNQMRMAPGWIGTPGLVGHAGYSLGTAIVLGESVVCVKRSRTCAALDPATGRTLWQRDGISAQSTVFGDDEYVLIVPPQSATATVLRTEDGSELEPRAIPPEEQRLATFGRRILRWQPHGRQYDLNLVDPLKSDKQGVLWGPLRFPVNSKYQLLEREAIAVYAPDGKFSLIRLADGEPIIEAQLEPESSLTDILVRRCAGQYVLVANNGATRQDTKRRVSQVAGVTARRIGVAKVYAFDSQGEALWEKPTIVADQFLPLIQPQEIPCLAFACMVQENVPDGQRRAKIDVLCVDARSGAVISQEDFPNTSQTLEIIGTPNDSKVEIHMQQQTLTLHFTDKPFPEDAKSKDASIQTPSNPLKAVWRAMLQGATTPERKENTPTALPATGERGDDLPKVGGPEPQLETTAKNAGTRNDGNKPPASGKTDNPEQISLPAISVPALEPAVRDQISPPPLPAR